MYFLGKSLPTPCATRWNTFYDCISSFLKNHKNLKTLNDVLQSIGLTYSFTKEDIEYLQEYCELMKPLAQALDIFQGQKECFLGIGMVLPLLTRVKKTLRDRFFPNLEPMRKRVIESINDRYVYFKNLPELKLYNFSTISCRFGNLFEDEAYLIAAATHPFF